MSDLNPRTGREIGSPSHLFINSAFLEDSEKLIYSMARAMPVMMWVANASGSRTLFNKSWRNSLGRTLNQEIDDWKTHIHPEDKRHYLANYKAALQKPKRYRSEYRIRRHDGDYRWFLETVVPRFGPDGKFLGLIGSAVDVTDRKRATEVATGQKRFLEMMTNGKPLSEIVAFLIGLLASQSPRAHAAVMLFDQRNRELSLASGPSLPKTFRDFLEQLPVVRGNGSCVAAVLRKRPVIVSDIRSNPVWGNVREFALTHNLRACASIPIIVEGWVLGTCCLYYREPRTPGRHDLKLLRMASHRLGIAIDRRNKEQAFKRAEKKHREIFENICEGIVQTTPDGRVITANPAMAQMLGYDSPADLMANLENITTQLYVDSNRCKEFQALIEDQRSVKRFEFEAYQKDRTRIWLSANVRVVRDEDRIPLYYEGTVEDITQRKETEATQRDLLNRVVAAQEEEQRRISRELHDHLAQSLTAIIFGLKSLEGEGLPGASNSLLRKLQDIAGGLSEEVRTLARRLRPPSLDDLGLQGALANCISEYSRLSGMHVDFHCNGLLSKRLPDLIETTVYRIVQESLTNVRKHGEATNVSVIVECRRNRVRAIVEDNGRGFDADMFLKTPSQGHGLGLLGMIERTKLVDGSINIESSPGGGTTVILRVPIS